MKIISTGHFYQGKMIGGWETEPPGYRDRMIVLSEDGRVLVGGIEIVPWSKARKESMKETSKGWVKI